MSQPDVLNAAELKEIRDLIAETRSLRETLQKRYVTRERYTRQYLMTIAAILLAIGLLATGIWKDNQLSRARHHEICLVTNKDQATLLRIVDESLASNSGQSLPPGTPQWAAAYIREGQIHSAAFLAQVRQQLKPLNCSV